MKMKDLFVPAVIGGLLVVSQVMSGQMGPGGPGRGPGGMHGMPGMHSGKVVTGEPYSATVTNTTVKTLTDGNLLQRTTTGTVARDAQGRTYSQETITGMFGQSGTRTVTFISDPVAGYVYTLNAETKTATRRALHVPSGSGSASHGYGSSAHPASANVVTAELGTQTVNGVSATGKTVTHTIPAGEMGNEKPIVSTTESWYSPDLQVVISSKRTDPRDGTSTYALTNIQRTEPASALFVLPSDYTVKDAPAFGGRH